MKLMIMSVFFRVIPWQMRFIGSYFVIPAKSGIQGFEELDYSLRSSFEPPYGRSMRSALLSGIRRNDVAPYFPATSPHRYLCNCI